MILSDDLMVTTDQQIQRRAAIEQLKLLVEISHRFPHMCSGHSVVNFTQRIALFQR